MSLWGKISFRRFKFAIFAVSKSTIFKKFKLVIYDKKMFQNDRVLAEPVDISMKRLMKRKKAISLEVGAACLNVNGFEKL